MSLEQEIKLINKLYKNCIDATIAIFYLKNTNELCALGTAFLCEYKEKCFLVSAAHVLNETKKRKLIAVLNGKAFVLDDIFLCLSKEYDIAIAKIEKSFLVKKGIFGRKMYAVPISRGEKYDQKYENCFLLGYPATQKNYYRRSIGILKRSIHCLSFYEKQGNIKSITEISSPIAFDYTLRGLRNENGNIVKLDKLNGLSGAPIFQIVKDGKVLNSVFVGIFCEWHKKNHEIIGASSKALINIIERNHA